MRKSKEDAAETRRRSVTAAASEFREHGIVTTGLADLMKAAGLTHGGFYKHFESKDQVVAEVLPAVARRRALAAVSMMIGAVTISRVVTDAKLSAEILREVETSLTEG